MTGTARHYDALIIGSGQGGTPLAAAFANAGRKTALVEREHVGGCCINDGCTPTKTMIASGRVAYLCRRAAEYGVHFGPPEKEETVVPLSKRPAVVSALSKVGMDGEDNGNEEEADTAKNTRPEGAGISDGDVRVDMEKVRQRKRDMVSSFRAGSERRLAAAGVDVLRGSARFVAAKTVAVAPNGGGADTQLTADLVFVNTGERPARPDLPGLDELDPSRVLDSTSVQELAEVPAHLLVLGGGPIGVEFAQLFRRLGAAVTVVQRAAQLLPREDADVAACLLDILRQDGVAVHVGARATRVSHNTGGGIALHLRGADGLDAAVAGSHLLLAAGRAPNTDALGLAAAGVATGPRGHVVVDERLATSAAGVYALGDVTGGPAFTHVSYDDFRILRDNLLSPPASPSSSSSAPAADGASRSPAPHTTAARALTTPYVIYTDPQLAHVGQHERALRAARPARRVRVAAMPMAAVARALEAAEPRGLIKAVVDADTGAILGFTCLGLDGGEVMAVVQMAMVAGVRWQVLREMVFAHPSLAEALNNLWAFLE